MCSYGQEQPHFVFVYGSLLPGLHNNWRLASAQFQGFHKTEPLYEMFSLGWYPAVCGDGTTAISGALYSVNIATLRTLDQLENHPSWYRREQVDLASTKQRAWMYLMPREEPELQAGRAERVPSGDWLDHRNGG